MLDISIYKKEELPYNSKSLLKWMWYFIKPFKKRFLLLSLNRLICAASFLLIPFFINLLIEYISWPNFELDKNFSYYYLLAIFIIFVIWNILVYLRKYEIFFRDEVKRKLTIFSTIQNLDLPLNWHENQWTWNKMQRILKAREAFKWLLNLFFSSILQQTWRILMIITVLLVSAPLYISFIFIIYALLFFLIAYLKSWKIWYLTDLVNIFYERVIDKWYEFASSIFTVKFFNLSKFIEKKSKKVEYEQMWKIVNMINAIYSKWLYLNLYWSLWYLLIAPLALYLFINWTISLWIFILIVWYIWDIRDSIASIWDIQDDYIENKSGFMLLTEVLNIETEKYDFLPIKKFPIELEKIFFNNLSFSYWNKISLKNINLNVKVWEKIALVWKSGSWKSTFVKLIMKQVLGNKGWIYFNNIDIKNIKKDELLTKISVVLQDTELFNISIKDNILLDIKWTKEEKKELLKKVMKMSYVDDFVNKLPEKENTIIWEKWVKLSGWEKQRIGIARALARQSEIIIFDEATSALDTESEQIIQKAMWEIFEWKTAFIIAHRLSTIKEVDRIIVFKDWKIIEDWSFKTLINKKWEFKKLWDLQKLD